MYYRSGHVPHQQTVPPALTLLTSSCSSRSRRSPCLGSCTCLTHLVQSAYYDTEKDIVQLQADPRLFELYQFDRKVLLQLKAINALKRRESAQALYTFIESLPRDPAPISLARLRARLNLKSPVFSQNQTVRRAMEQLREIGYLDYTEIQRGRTKLFCIH